MSYVIYNKETKIILKARARSVGCYIESYKSEAAAKAALTRLANKDKLGENCEPAPTKKDKFAMKRTPWTKDDFAIAERSYFNENIDIKVKRRDAMTGEEFEESINANWTTSRASETYYCS